MNIAFPAFFLLALVLTGVIFLNSFERKENTNLEKTPFSNTSARALVFSALIHMALLSVVNSFFIPVDFAVSIKLITGTNLEATDISNLSQCVLYIATYFISSYVVAFLLGKALQIAVLSYFPYKSSFFAFDTPWYYELKGKLSEQDDAQIIKLSCLVDSDHGSYLYYGYLEDFYLDVNGQLDRFVLSDVYRRNLEDDEDIEHTEQEGTNSKSDLRFYQIKGDRLVIKFDRVINLNIEYIYIQEVTDRTESRGQAT